LRVAVAVVVGLVVAAVVLEDIEVRL